MKVADFCTRDPATVEPLASLREAAMLMRKRHVGALIVVEEAGGKRRPAGILTDRDIVVAAIAVPGARPEGIRVCDAMSASPAVAREDEGAFDAARTMAERGVRRLPVVSADGLLVGIVTANDVLRAVSAGLAALASAHGKGAEREQAGRA